MTETFAWLIESPIQDAQGPYYLCVQRVAGCWFEWKPDHQRAIRFIRKEDAEAVRDAVRELRPDLFPAIMPFPQAVEHGWCDNPLPFRIQAGERYWNGLGDEVGPMEERTPGVFMDQHGGIYHPDGRQWNHTSDSAGNIMPHIGKKMQAYGEYRAHGGKLDFTAWQERQKTT